MRYFLCQGRNSLRYQKLIMKPDTEFHRCLVPVLYFLVYVNDAPWESGLKHQQLNYPLP